MVAFKICLFSLFFFSFVLGACTIKADNLKDTESWSLVSYTECGRLTEKPYPSEGTVFREAKVN